MARRRTPWLIGLACLLLAVALPSADAEAQALVRELRLGVLAHDVPDLWSGFQLEPSSVDINVEAVFAPSLPFLGGAIRPAIGASINTRGATSHVYIDARWEIEGPAGLFFGLGLGAALHNGETGTARLDRKALGSELLFHIPAEIGIRLDGHNSLSVYFEHTSNAYTQTHNEGMDRLGIRYGYRF